MRLAQEDILRYTLDPDWESPSFPEGYWPENPSDIPDNIWNSSIDKFLAGLEEVVGLANNLKVDLTSQLPHGGEHTCARFCW